MAWRKFHQEQSAHQPFVPGVVGSAKQVRQPSVEPDFFDLSLSPLAFCDDRAQGDRCNPCKCCNFCNAYTAATKLLNFAPALTRPFRIVWTVTILQQIFPCFY